MAKDSRSGWLDEFWTVLLAAPVALAFLPWTQDTVRQGFEIIGQSVPLWYQSAWGVSVAWGFARPHLAGLWRGRSRQD